MTAAERKLAGVATMVLSPVIYLTVVWVSYYPDKYPGWSETKQEVFFWAAVFLSLTGAYFATRGQSWKWFTTAVVLFVYLLLLAIGLVFAAGFIACMNGDCL